MKKILLPMVLTAAVNIAFGQARAQHSINTLMTGKNSSFTGHLPYHGPAAKASSLGDTLYYYNNSSTLLLDSSVALRYDGITPNDTGYLFGTNVYGDSAFAEMYDFTWGPDTSVSVLGLLSYWSGTVSPSSTDSVTFHVWGLDTTKYQLDTNTYAWNFPGASLGSKKTALTALNVGGNQYITTWFDAPVSGITSSFYAGYSYSYDPAMLNGDTITLRSTPNGMGNGTGQYTLMNNGVDTYLTTRNAVMETDGYWYDVYNDYNYNVNLSLVPIFQLNQATGLHGISKNGLSLNTIVPNPASSSISVDFALQQAANISIDISDMSGKILQSAKEMSFTAGCHSVPISLSQYPTGNYICILRSGNGAIMAALFSIEK